MWVLHFAFLPIPQPQKWAQTSEGQSYLKQLGRIFFFVSSSDVTPENVLGIKHTEERPRMERQRKTKDWGTVGTCIMEASPQLNFHSCAGPATLWFERSAPNQAATSLLWARNQHNSSCLASQVITNSWKNSWKPHVTPTPAWSVYSTVCAEESLSSWTGVRCRPVPAGRGPGCMGWQ